MSGSGDAMNDNAIRNELAALRHQVERLQSPQNRLSAFLEQFARLKQLRQQTAENRLRMWQAAPKQTEAQKTHVYQPAAGRDGYKLALRGFDFVDKNELERVRREYKACLKVCGIDPREADQLQHSWEFAAHRYESPNPGHTVAWCQTGKGFLVYATWLGSLDIRPGSIGLKLWDHYLELKSHAEHKDQIYPRYFRR